MNDLQKYSDQTFDNIKHINDDGIEFWYVRELQSILEYAQWRRFSETIEHAKAACSNSGNVGKMVNIGSGAEREIDDIMLFRIRWAERFAKQSNSLAALCRRICPRLEKA